MTLILTAIRCPSPLRLNQQRVTTREFKLGRGADNDWVMPDPAKILSKHHCSFLQQGSFWVVSDTSANGTFINEDDEPIGPGHIRAIANGDRLRLGGYEISVEIEVAAPVPEPVAVNGAHHDEMTPTENDKLMDAFLKGAGISGAVPANPLQMMHDLGAAMRALVAGTRNALIARSEVKNDFRISQTMIRQRGNNPLKFSADDDDALAALLGLGWRSEITPAAAISEVLADICRHEAALMLAMKETFRTVLAEFSPDACRAEAEAGGLALLPAQKKARAFEAFERLYDDISHYSLDDFSSPFGKSFAHAYETAACDLSRGDRQKPPKPAKK